MINEMENEETKSIFAEMLLEEIPNMNFDEIINSVKLRKYNSDLENINEQIRNNADNSELYKAKKELKKKILSLNKKVVNRTLY
ncbi:MAG: hypothetical protein B6D62_00925 [Candidatus Cloacimonas sp. 4484_275]|nr:MAG: hypothetical protein B6D62_00925 [Candidatus Cloacimonas sp. 4484_275]